MNQTIRENFESVESAIRRLDHVESRNNSIKSAVEIFVVYPDNTINDRGSGNLINYKGEPAISTNKHVVVEKIQEYLKDIGNEKFKEYAKEKCLNDYRIYHPILKKSYNSTKFLLHEHEDIALIFLDVNAEEKLELLEMAAKVSKKKALLGTNIEGFCVRDYSTIFNYGRILQGPSPSNNNYVADVAGTFGYSGCGYFNPIGELCLIHVWIDVAYLRSSNKASHRVIAQSNHSNETLSTEIKNLVKNTTEEYIKKILPDFITDLNQEMIVKFHNPRMSLLDASLLFGVKETTLPQCKSFI